MTLLTLGRLELAGHSFSQRQALLLLAYLTIEGRKERAFLAELFWPDAAKPLNNLSSALTRLRSVDRAMVSADRYGVEATVASDVDRFVRHAAAGERAEALDLYRGRFLDGVALDPLGYELEEWLLDQRAALAGTARDCSRQLALDAYAAGRLSSAVELAEQALAIGHDGVPDGATLSSLYPILNAGNSPLAQTARSEAAEFGVDLTAETGPAVRYRTPARAGRPFFGRDAELAEVERGLTEERVVALVGLGGIGKSELARVVARRTEQAGRTVVWVDGARTGSVEELLDLVARHVGPDDPPEPTVDAIGDAVGTRSLTVVLDSIEALAEDLGPLSQLLGRCPGLRLLITSRVETAIEPCTTVTLVGLPIGGALDEPGPAIELFHAWFERNAPVDAELDQNDAAVAEICQRLEGHPLAIELAAGWLNILTPAEIAVVVANETGVTSVGSNEIDSSESEVHSLMAATWELLDETSRSAQARLSIVSGGFDRATAEIIGGCTLDVLRRLARWSLIARRDGNWYRCHALVHSFAKERLEEQPGWEQAARRAHAELVLDAAAAHSDADTLEGGDLLGGFEDPVGNLLLAWHFALDQRSHDALAALVDPLDRMLGRAGQLRALHEALGAAVDVLSTDVAGKDGVDGHDNRSATRARLEMHLVWLHLRLGDYGAATALADRLLNDPATTGDLIVELTRARAAIHRTEGAVEVALDQLIAVRDTAKAVSDRMLALIDDDIGLCQMVLGLYPESRESYRGVLAWARKAGSQPIIARTLLSLGIGHHDSGEFLDSLAYLIEAKSVVAVNGLTQLEPYVDVKLARTHLAEDELEAADRLVEAARARSGSTLEPWLDAEFDLISARLAAARGEPTELWSCIERALTTAADIEDVPFVAKAFVTMVELGADQPEIGPSADGGLDLLASVADGASGADHADREGARDLLDRIGADLETLPVKPIADQIDVAYSYLRRARILTGRRQEP